MMKSSGTSGPRGLYLHIDVAIFVKRELQMSKLGTAFALGASLFLLSPASARAQGQETGTGSAIVLSRFLLLESERAEGAHLDLASDSAGVTEYSGGILPTPGGTGDRMYTFKAAFAVADELRAEEFSLYVGLAEYPFRIYLNGTELFAKGRYKHGRYNSSLRSVSSVYLPPSFLKYDGENVLVMEIYPQFETWGLDRLYIDKTENVARAVFFRNFMGINLVQAAFVLALVMSLYFLALFFAEKKGRSDYLYFAIICIAFCLSYFNVTIHYEANDEVFLEALSKAGLVLLSTFMFFFCVDFTGVFKQRKVFLRVMLALSAFCAVFVLVQRSKAAILGTFGLVMNFLIVPQLLLEIFTLAYALVRKRNTRVVPLLVAFVVVISTAVHDVLYLNQSMIPYAWYTAYGYFAIIIAIFSLLAVEQAKLYRDALFRERELDRRNREQNELIDRIKLVSENLVGSGTALETTIRNSTDIVARSTEKGREVNRSVTERFDKLKALIDILKDRIDKSSGLIPAALSKQTDAVEQMSLQVAKVNSHMESIYAASSDSGKEAADLASLAQKSTGVIRQSGSSIEAIGQYSRFIEEVLEAIEDITERMNILSINAAIEAARAGKTGLGFAVVAAEVRQLSARSQEQLDSSFNKIKDMTGAIKTSEDLSGDVSQSLQTIIQKIQSTAELANTIKDRLADQQAETRGIQQALEELLENTRIVESISQANTEEDKQFSSMLTELTDTFLSIIGMIAEQQAENERLQEHIRNIEEQNGKNFQNVGILNSSVRAV